MKLHVKSGLEFTAFQLATEFSMVSHGSRARRAAALTSPLAVPCGTAAGRCLLILSNLATRVGENPLYVYGKARAGLGHHLRRGGEASQRCPILCGGYAGRDWGSPGDAPCEVNGQDILAGISGRNQYQDYFSRTNACEALRPAEETAAPNGPTEQLCTGHPEVSPPVAPRYKVRCT